MLFWSLQKRCNQIRPQKIECPFYQRHQVKEDSVRYLNGWQVVSSYHDKITDGQLPHLEEGLVQVKIPLDLHQILFFVLCPFRLSKTAALQLLNSVGVLWGSVQLTLPLMMLHSNEHPLLLVKPLIQCQVQWTTPLISCTRAYLRSSWLDWILLCCSQSLI